MKLGEMEDRLRTILAETTGRQEFFALDETEDLSKNGWLTSYEMLLFLAEIEMQLGAEIEIEELIQCPTIQRLGEFLLKQKR